MTRVASIIGGRPHPIKVAPIHRALSGSKSLRHVVIDFGYLDKLYAHETYTQLQLPNPAARFAEPSHAERREVFTKLVHQVTESLERVEPDHLLIYGDIDVSAAAAIAASGASVEYTHVEAGLRSHDYEDREEVNRLLIDRLASLYVTHSVRAVDTLRAEGSGDGDIVLLTASPAIETLYTHLELAHNGVLEKLGLTAGTYCLATVHRNEVLREAERFSQVINALVRLADSLPVVLINYRSTRAVIDRTFAGIDNQLVLTPTLSYLDYVSLLKGARLVVTDSSGLHDEAAALSIPSVTCRPSTHRSNNGGGANRVVGFDASSIVQAGLNLLDRGVIVTDVPSVWRRPAGTDIAAFLHQHLNQA